MRNIIREEIGDAKFCILVDEAKDAANREQMAIVLRFVDVHGFLREHFFEIVNVTDTTAFTLKKEISDVLARYNLNIENMRGQEYDGASNMRGAWNGLQVLFLKDCPYAYYIHYFAHRLQLALVAAAQNDISVCLIDMYGATIKVLQTMVEEGSSNSIRGEAGGALIAVRFFDFIFILHLMHRIMGIIDLLFRALQHKSLDILNAIDLVSTTKALLQILRQDGFNTLLMHVGSVCTLYDIEMPMMDGRYKEVIGHSCQ
ncbi:uncharacterized protein LOC130788916 [Actinidia eriantha]|uniref:uncharacterized protein LOC130788916 n=1 Tax=Actinidia eriantha TaxID=165200 RepID=UPI00258A0AD3|nr:uncharacterized protein LOC130788916 [Actinidia eriantha]